MSLFIYINFIFDCTLLNKTEKIKHKCFTLFWYFQFLNNA